jgi:hypothetical protein
VWLVAVLLAARVLGLLAGRVQLRRAGLSARVDRALINCARAAAATVGGASAAATHRSALVVVALAVLAAVEAVALRDARVPLRALCASVLKRGAVELAH